MVIDIRTTLAVAAFNHGGIIDTRDLDKIADDVYFFTSDYAFPLTPMYDPKFSTMATLYLDNSSVAYQRLGNYAFAPTMQGYSYSETTNFGTETNPYYHCPSACETASNPCSTPAFQFEFKPPVNATFQSNSPEKPFIQFGFSAFSDELYVINSAKMDPGRIACKTTQAGSKGKLGNLDPVSSAAFLSGMKSSKPFKLAESYFSCYPDPYFTFLDSVGIAHGNSSLFFSVLMNLAVIVLSAMKLYHVVSSEIVSESDIDSSSILLSEIVKLKQSGRSLGTEHTNFLSALRLALSDESPSTESVIVSQTNALFTSSSEYLTKSSNNDSNPSSLLSEILLAKEAGAALTEKQRTLLGTLRSALEDVKETKMNPHPDSLANQNHGYFRAPPNPPGPSRNGNGAKLDTPEQEIELQDVYSGSHGQNL